MLSDKQENEFRLVLANAAKHFDEFSRKFLENEQFYKQYVQAKESANMCKKVLKMETIREK